MLNFDILQSSFGNSCLCFSRPEINVHSLFIKGQNYAIHSKQAAISSMNAALGILITLLGYDNRIYSPNNPVAPSIPLFYAPLIFLL